ncbi:MAG: hypothetical protein IJ635_10935 [Bacteroidaceae bacterium]|nr:hypothetical protein [Bacteroidaceae bacterium]
MKKIYIRPEMEIVATVEAAPLCASGVAGGKESVIEDVLFGGFDEVGDVEPSAPMRNILDKDDKFGDPFGK